MISFGAIMLIQAASWLVWQLSRHCPTVSIRGNDLDTALFSGQAFSHLLWTIESATALSCVSTQYAQRLRGMSEKIQQVVVLGNATDTDVFAPSSVADKYLTMHKRPNPFVLGFSGELRRRKG